MTTNVREIRTASRRVRQLRNNRDMTKVDLATKSGLSVDTISRIENAVETGYNPHLATIASIAGALNVKTGEIVNRGFLVAF